MEDGNLTDIFTCVSGDSLCVINPGWSTINLDVTTYRNGDEIPEVTDNTAWSTLTTGAWCYYDNDYGVGGVYGKLYNWYAVNDPRGIAPVGYHIPTDTEWTTLTNCLGGALVAGGKMKEVGFTHWDSPNTDATNSSGFTVLPGGFRSNTGAFSYIQYYGSIWSSSESTTLKAWYRNLQSLTGAVFRSSLGKTYGMSVRIIQD